MTEVAAPRRWILAVAAVGLVVGSSLATHFVGAALGDDDAEGDEHEEDKEKGKEPTDAKAVLLGDEARKNAGIEVAEARAAMLGETLTVPGEVVLDVAQMGQVSPRVGGVLSEVRRRVGDAVEKGEVLAILESRELAELGRAARSAEEDVRLAEAIFQRTERLRTQGIAAEKDYLAARSALAQARIARAAAAEAMRASGATGGAQHRLVAPLAGTIIEARAVLGEVVAEDARVFVVADLSRSSVDVDVYAKDLAVLAVGQRAIVHASAIEHPAQGTVERVPPVADVETHNGKARILLGGLGPMWRAGLLVTVDIEVARRRADVTVPDSAIVLLGAQPTVFVPVEAGYEARTVRLGGRGVADEGAGVRVEILAGVASGDEVVVAGALVLKAELGKSTLAAADDD